tara:strand:+ start:4301 stop:5179 length:879 start_codon:yes stop_codon:yes gene_type:complete
MVGLLEQLGGDIRYFSQDGKSLHFIVDNDRSNWRILRFPGIVQSIEDQFFAMFRFQKKLPSYDQWVTDRRIQYGLENGMPIQEVEGDSLKQMEQLFLDELFFSKIPDLPWSQYLERMQNSFGTSDSQDIHDKIVAAVKKNPTLMNLSPGGTFFEEVRFDNQLSNSIDRTFDFKRYVEKGVFPSNPIAPCITQSDLVYRDTEDRYFLIEVKQNTLGSKRKSTKRMKYSFRILSEFCIRNFCVNPISVGVQYRTHPTGNDFIVDHFEYSTQTKQLEKTYNKISEPPRALMTLFK